MLVALVVQATVAFTTIAQGTDSQISEFRLAAVRTTAEWQAFWNDHASEPPPTIDFSQFVVVGVFLGSRPTAGYQVEITAVSSKGEVTTVEYVEHRPAPGALVAQVLTSPFHLIRLPRTVDNIEFRRIDPLI